MLTSSFFKHIVPSWYHDHVRVVIIELDWVFFQYFLCLVGDVHLEFALPFVAVTSTHSLQLTFVQTQHDVICMKMHGLWFSLNCLICHTQVTIIEK